MGNKIDYGVILGSLRYKSASNTDFMFQVPLIQTSKQNIEYERNIDVDLAIVYDNERQKSDIFRPTCKFSILFKNSYTGSTNYVPLENNLQYVNEESLAALSCLDQNPDNVKWEGFLQYNEFDFIRNDYNIPGYTTPPNNHINFITKSASSYNWSFYMTYPFENVYNKDLQCVEGITDKTLNWIASDGIPFVIENNTSNGSNIISFLCPVNHNLTIGEAVKLSFSYNGNDTFLVYSLGNNNFGSDKTIFNIYDVGFTGSTFDDYVSGTFKRIINISSPLDTSSIYYVRRHKVLTKPEDSVLVNAGFDQNIFGTKKKYESGGYTPNKTSRISIKEGSQSYTLSFNSDIQINPIRDNLKRPITELFYTVIWKGFFGYTFGRIGNYKMKQGFDFNLPLVKSTKLPNSWWSFSNNKSNTDFMFTTYETSLGVNPSGQKIKFAYVKPLNVGDTLDGDYCEWNSYEQKERVISNLYHKITHNSEVFNIGILKPLNIPMTTNNPFGYYYQPHHSLTIRKYSSYIEEGDKKNVIDIPDYSYFSTTKNLFIWRDIYTYGFIDAEKIGVNYPFLNGVHYPYRDIIFRIIPEGSNYKENTIIAEPTIDDCE
jgi:hypothetical protein